MNEDILKKNSIIKLTGISNIPVPKLTLNPSQNISVVSNDITAIVKEVIKKTFPGEINLNKNNHYVDHDFERSLITQNGNNTSTYENINKNRHDLLQKNDSVLVYIKDNDDLFGMDNNYELYDIVPTARDFSISDTSITSNNTKYLNKVYNDKYYKQKVYDRPGWFKGVVKQKKDNNMINVELQDGTSNNYDVEYVRKFDEAYDTDYVNVLTKKVFDDDSKLMTLNITERSRENNKIKATTANNTVYHISKEVDVNKINEMKKLKEQYDTRMEKRKQKTRYILKWFYKTNYSGSKYYPLKISNIELLSEADKYAQIEKYTELKRGDIVKYNDPNHRNHELLAKITNIKEDPLSTQLYNTKTYLYDIKFEPLETYIEKNELEEYQQKYENMITTIPNVKLNKLLKIRYVELEYYSDDIKTLLENKSKLDTFNNYITENTLDRLKKNTIFNLDYVLSKYQPESGVKDLNALIKPVNTNTYTISHSPVIKKRPSGQFFEIKTRKLDEEDTTVDIDIYVDLLLFQSKTISEEEWNKTPLSKKLGTILGEQIKNSYAGVLNCPSTFDKLKTVTKNLFTKGLFIDKKDSINEVSETNLIKKTFNQTEKQIKALKNEIAEKEQTLKNITAEVNNKYIISTPLKKGELDMKKKDLSDKKDLLDKKRKELKTKKETKKELEMESKRKNEMENVPININDDEESKTDDEYSDTEKQLQNSIDAIETEINELTKEIEIINKELKIKRTIIPLSDSDIVNKQMEIGELNEVISNDNARLIKLESLLKQKGGRKTRRNKPQPKRHAIRLRKTRKHNKYKNHSRIKLKKTKKRHHIR